MEDAVVMIAKAIATYDSLQPDGAHHVFAIYKGEYAVISVGDDYPLELKEKCFDKCKFALLRKEFAKRRYQALLDHGVPQSTLEKMSDYQEVMS
jgi:hypothetical protein